MIVLAASLDDSQEVEAGDVIWAKLTGHALWPAVVIDESLTVDRKGLSKTAGGRSVPVQFFGTHDFARVRVNQVISFFRGLISSFHPKCKKPRVIVGLEEAKMYLSEQKLPERMLRLQNGMMSMVMITQVEMMSQAMIAQEILLSRECWKVLRMTWDCKLIISLGKIVKDSKYFNEDGSFGLKDTLLQGNLLQ